MKKRIISLILSFLLFPLLVFANNGDEISLFPAIIMEAFITIHMSLFVLKPLSEMLSKDNPKSMFWKLFIGRIIILLFSDSFITTNIAIVDVIALFVGAFAIAIISSIKSLPINNNNNLNLIDETRKGETPMTKNYLYKCKNCNTQVLATDQFCQNCGNKLTQNNIIKEETTEDQSVKESQIEYVLPSNYDSIYSLSETRMIEEFLKRELTKAGIGLNTKLIPSEILKRKRILNIIFSILLFIYISLIFFHFPIYTYVLGLIILIIFFIMTKRYNLIKYLSKEIKSRPQEKISNIVMNVKSSFMVDNTLPLFIGTLLVAIILPLIIFINPRIIYEKVDNGYGVRFYIFGLTNFKTATIPDTYKGEKVVTLRGNTFSNMPFLESVNIPNTVTEIRGQAFKNCKKLTKVNIPSNLEYLGGGAFYNAKSLKSIVLPDTLKYMGGETFYGASSLQSVKLPANLPEIRGDSFEYCTSLQSISIPDSVTRIGGHAFYGDTALSKVEISKNSQLNEIGSSAFRLCTSLYEIHIPANTYVNERAFKESPTNVLRYGDSSYNNNYYPYNYYQ